MQTQHAAYNRDYLSFAEFYQNSVYSAFMQEHRSCGSFGLHMMRVDQEPIDFVDAAVPDLVFTRTENDVGEVLFDLGDGVSVSQGHRKTLAYYPAETEARTRVEVPHRVTVLTLNHNKVADLMAEAGGGLSSMDRFSAKMSENIAASSLMDRIWHATSDAGPAASLYVDGLALQFLSIMTRASGLAPLGGARPEDERIARVIDYVEAHFGEPFDIDTLAGIACLSPAHFSRVFKATIGTPVWAYVQERRCVRAKEMLVGTRLPLIEVAFRCGFSSQAHFTRAISKHFGITPGALRENGAS
ncbi:MAG: AraC family transcriptional regulator [Pseudomonadota bacterium]